MSNTPKSRMNLTAIIALGLCLGACAGQTPSAPINHDARMRAAAEIVRLPQSFTPGDLADETTRDLLLENFLIESEARYGDRFWIDASADLSEDKIAGLTRAITIRGLTVSGVAALGPMPEKGGATVYLERYIATAPECGQWPEEEFGAENNTSAFWGCANTSNLAMMVADPRDLVAGKKGKPGTDGAVAAIRKTRAAQNSPQGMAGQQQAVAGNN